METLLLRNRRPLQYLVNQTKIGKNISINRILKLNYKNFNITRLNI